MVMPDGYPRAARGRPAAAAASRPTSLGSTHGTRPRSAGGGAATSTTCCGGAPTRSNGADVRGSATMAVPALLRRRVPGRHPAPGARLLARGSASVPICAWSAMSRRRSTGSPAPTHAARVLRRAVPGRRSGRARSQLPIDAAGRRRRRGCTRERKRASSGRPSGRSGRTARRRSTARTRTRPPRPPRSPRRVGRRSRPGFRSTGWQFCSERTRRRRRSRWHSPGGAFRAGCRTPGGSWNAPSCGHCWTGCAGSSATDRAGRSPTPGRSRPGRRRDPRPNRTTRARTAEPASTYGEARIRSASAAAEERREHRGAVLRLGREYLGAEDGPGSVAGFVAWLDLATRGDNCGPGVDLLTFHRAKVSSGRSSSSSASKPDSCRSRGRRRPASSPRNGGCSTLPSAAPRMRCGSRGPDTGRWAAAAHRDPSPWLHLLERRANEVAPPAVDGLHELAVLRETLAGMSPPRSVPRRSRPGR